MENRNIFWGVLLVAIGSLFILDNVDLINFSFSALISLWPLLLIAWGISILPIKKVYKNVTSLVIVIFAVAYASTSERSYWEDRVREKIDNRIEYSNEDYEDEYEEENYYVFQFDEESEGQISYATLSMDVAAGKFRIDGVTEEHIIDFEAYSNFGPYSSEMVMNGDRADIQIGFDEAVMKSGTNKNRANLKLNPKIEWEVNLNVGAADFRGDFSAHKISRIDLDGGASAIRLKLGDLQKETNIKLDAGAASIKIDIPTNAGCKIVTDGFLVDKDFEGFKKTESGEYVSSNYNDSDQKIYIDLDAAILQFTVHRY